MRFSFSSSLVTDAFRFWFDASQVDYGYALRLTSDATQELRAHRAESGLGERAPYLVITYDLSSIVSVRRETIIREGDEWRFWRGATPPPSLWREPETADSDWESGPTGIGYGDGDDNTVLTDMRCNGGGEGEPCLDGGYLAFFARKRFELVDVGEIERATLTVSYDDGFAAYVNGVEVGRVQLPPGEIDETTAATGVVGNAPEEPNAVIDVSPTLLREGENVLAVSVHNANLTSSDASFIPELEIVRRVSGPPGEGSFRRGDVDASGSMELTDALAVFNVLFLGAAPFACADAADVDDDGKIVISDGIQILNVLFLGSGAIAAPGFESCGEDPTPEDPSLPACAYDVCGL